MFITKKEIKKVEAFILSYLDSYLTKRDLKETLKFLEKKISGIGSGKDEVSKTTEITYLLFERDIKQCPSPIDYKIIYLNIEKIKRALFICDLILKVQPNIEDLSIYLDVRMSFLILKKTGKFKIRHFHVSMPYKEQKENESYPIETVKKQKEILEEMLKEKTVELEKTIEKLKEVDNIKNTIFAIMTHDLRTPFATAISLFEILEESPNEIISNINFIESLKMSFKNVLSLLENLITWAKDQIEEKENIEPILIEKIIEDIIKLYHKNIEEKRIKVVINVERDNIINLNRNLLSMILRNLIYNSIKYCRNEGIIKIKDKKIANAYFILVEDNGIGISPNKLKNILELTKNKVTVGTAKEQGTGLGLFLINQILAKNNGKIKVKSIEGKYTRATVMFKTQ